MINHIEHNLIKKINAQLEQCTICEGYNTRGGNFISHNQKEVDVIFIAQNPGQSWWDKEVKPEEIIPFALDNDKNRYHLFFDLFRKAFEEEYKREPVFYLTNIVKCVTENNTLEDTKMISTCIKKYLLKEIFYFRHYNPNIKIVTLGKPAEKALSRFEEFDNIQIYNLYHPGWMNRQGPKVVKEKADLLMEYIKK